MIYTKLDKFSTGADEICIPLDRSDSIVEIIRQFRCKLISEADVYAKLRTIGINNKSALDYVELVVGR